MGFLIRPTSLFFKVIVVTNLVLILAISFHLWWNISLFEGSIETMTREKTRIISEFIEKNVIRAMEKGRHFDIHRILQNFTVYQGVIKINLFTMDGVIRATTQVNELNKNVGDVNFYLNKRYYIHDEIAQDAKGRVGNIRVYYFNSPIFNHPECFQCHDRKNNILGVLTVANTLKENDEMVSKVKYHSIILAIVTIGFLSFVLIFLFVRFVEHPIKKMTDVMGRVEGGSFDARVGMKSMDEMGKLGKSLDAMIEKLKLAKEEAEFYHQELVQRADRMATIGELASGIAHEIRNPLAGIHGAIQIIAEGLPKEDSRRQITEEVQKQIHRLERLVKDLLNYAKPVPPSHVSADINDLAEKVLSFFLAQRGKSENFRIEKSFHSPLPKVLIDPNSIEQAFLNILLNAQKAMPKGGTLTVSTRFLNSKDLGQGEVQIIFEDTGMGIKKENLQKIFDPFFSTRSDGTGLGLSITKKIIEQYQGRIDVESQVNVGTKFIITLPAIES